ncbi:unnamed protein product [Amoebophrya sp. A25]|nr:unnamed protein product [Amoebophrya sp. A25]|eukprot:GSA25T00014422001.1
MDAHLLSSLEDDLCHGDGIVMPLRKCHGQQEQHPCANSGPASAYVASFDQEDHHHLLKYSRNPRITHLGLVLQGVGFVSKGKLLLLEPKASAPRVGEFAPRIGSACCVG